jgi:hypothetical protein
MLYVLTGLLMLFALTVLGGALFVTAIGLMFITAKGGAR